MSYWYTPFLFAVVAALAVFGSPRTARSQGEVETAVRPGGTAVNLFKTIDPTRPIDGAVVELPPEWGLLEIRLLRYGTEPVSAEVRPRDDDGTHLVVTDRAIRGPHEVVVRVQLPDRVGTFEWGLHSFVWQKPDQDTASQSRIQRLDRKRSRVEVKPSSNAPWGNRALDLSASSQPLLLRADHLPPLGQSSSFTIEFWLQTNGLGEVVLSTWNGNEEVAYPAEFIVDRSGRLRFYSGRPGQHQALRSGRPIADGRWHHVAAVYAASQSRLRLFVDGTRADSLRGQLPISPGPVPMALGGRLYQGRDRDQEQSPLFSGLVDEVRIWTSARSLRALRRMKGRPVQEVGDEFSKQDLVRLGFDEEAEPAVERWPEGAQRVPVMLAFRSGLRNLRAKTNGKSVTLRWAAEASAVETFVVERSADGTTFSVVDELSPSAARRPTSASASEFRYTDQNVPGQVVYYRIREQQEDGSERRSGTIKIGLGAADEEAAPVRLIGNFPNPFSKSTTIAYEVRSAQPVDLTVWDLKGHRIAELETGAKEPGYHETSFSATSLTSGTYFVRLETREGVQSHRMVVLK